MHDFLQLGFNEDEYSRWPSTASSSGVVPRAEAFLTLMIPRQRENAF